MFAKYNDGRMQRASVHPFSSTAFNPALPLDSRTPTRFKTLFPEAFSSLLSNAQALRSHRFEFLGHAFQYGPRINWHLDTASTKEWQKKIYTENALQDEGSPPDPKLVWELNRHQYFVTLAQAFYVSGDRAYLDELVAQWLHWIEENPYRTGINWASPLEVGIRLISWTLAFQFIEHHCSQKDRTAIAKSVWEQTFFVSSHLSLDKIVRTNHLIGEAAGLYIAASSFLFHESAKWMKTAQDILEKEIDTQVFEDGVAKEQSSSYHRFDVDFFLLCYLDARKSASPFSSRFGRRLQKMIRYLLLLQSPGSDLPAYGDFDNGRGFTLAPSLNFWDARGLIAVAGAVFQNQEMSSASFFNEESFWLLSETEWNSPKTDESGSSDESFIIFPDSRHVIFGNRQAGDYCFFRAGEFGMGGNGFSSHSHNDLFSPIIYLNWNSILADTGTSVYLGNDEERNYLRSAAAHNTTFSPAWNFFEVKRGFGWKKSRNGTITKSIGSEKEIVIECTFEKPSKDFYKRIIAYQPIDHIFTVEDSFAITGRDVHTYFHLDHGLNAQVREQCVFIHRNGKEIAQCIFSDRLNVKVEQGWISKSYGTKEASVILHFTWNSVAHQPERFTFKATNHLF
ncbi:MAG: heparinase II/III family protein [Bacteroidota bacterium]